MDDKKLKVYGVETKDGFYLSTFPFNWYFSDNGLDRLHKMLIDGNPPQPTFHHSWVFVAHEPVRISHMQRQPNINYRYEIIDKTLESERFPAVLVRDDVAYLSDGDWCWKEEFAHLRSLYNLVSDEQPAIEIEDPFDLVIVASVETVSAPEKLQYTVAAGRWASDGKTVVTNESIEHQLFDRIIFPNITLHEKPSRLSSKDSYRIVREYVKNNLNPLSATITSDYDFCFTVQKRVPKAKPYHYQVDVNNSIWDKKKRRPKYENRVNKEVLLPCFEMTWSPENYKGYTPIVGFEAENETALKETIDAYLEHLMSVINEPMKECTTCCGIGYLMVEEA